MNNQLYIAMMNLAPFQFCFVLFVVWGGVCVGWFVES